MASPASSSRSRSAAFFAVCEGFLEALALSQKPVVGALLLSGHSAPSCTIFVARASGRRCHPGASLVARKAGLFSWAAAAASACSWRRCWRPWASLRLTSSCTWVASASTAAMRAATPRLPPRPPPLLAGGRQDLLNVELGLFFDELRREDALGSDSPLFSFQSLLVGLRDDGAALRQGLVVVVRRPDFRGGLSSEEGSDSTC